MRCLIALLLTLLATASSGCSSEKAPTTIVLLRGQEDDAFTRSPTPQTISIAARSGSGARKVLSSVPFSASASFDIADLDGDQSLAFEALLTDSQGNTLLRGQSLSFSLSQVAGLEIPIFVGRINEMSRPSGLLPTSRSNPLSAVVVGSFLICAGGEDLRDASNLVADPSEMAGFDLTSWQTLEMRDKLPIVPQSMGIISDRYAILINGSAASLFDFVTYDTYNPSNPSNFSFSDVSAGDAIQGEIGESYVVGPTRSLLPSSQVLIVDTDLKIHEITLGSARNFASATWVTGIGLAVLGGSSSAPALEILAPLGDTLRHLDYPSLDSHGSAAVSLEGGRILVAGGKNSTGELLDARVFDVNCSANCQPVLLADSAAKIGLSVAKGYAISKNQAVLVGQDATDQQTRVVRLTLDPQLAIEEVKLKQPRSHAGSVLLPNGMIALLGGLDLNGNGLRSVEVFVPQGDSL